MLPELAVVRKEVRNNWYNPATFVPAKLVIETPLLVLPPLLLPPPPLTQHAQSLVTIDARGCAVLGACFHASHTVR